MVWVPKERRDICSQSPRLTLLEPESDDHLVTELWPWIWRTFQGPGDSWASLSVWISLSSPFLPLVLWKDTSVYLTLLLCWEYTKCLKWEEKKNFFVNCSQWVNLLSLVTAIRLLTSRVLYISCYGIGISHLSVQGPFMVVTASDENQNVSKYTI